jgi:hypothetical protein
VVAEFESWLGTVAPLWDITSEHDAHFELMHAILCDLVFGAPWQVRSALLRLPKNVNLTSPAKAVTPLMAAVQTGDLEVVKALKVSGLPQRLERRIDPTHGNALGITPLVVATRLGRADMIEFVLNWCDDYVDAVVHDVIVTIFTHVKQ